MSDISTDLQDAIDSVHAPLPEGRMFLSSEISPECVLKSTAQAMVHRFRELRDDWRDTNRRFYELRDAAQACMDAKNILALADALKGLREVLEQVQESP